MDKILYLEIDEEITLVVDRLRKIKEKKIALVIPKRAVLIGSVVNLKLLKKQAQQLGKELSIVTVDKIGRNLASQVGFTVYQKLDKSKIKAEAEVTQPPKIPKISLEDSYKELKQEEKPPSSLKIKEVKKEPEPVAKPPAPPAKSFGGTQDKPFDKIQGKPILKKKKRRRPIVLPSIDKRLLVIFIVLSILILGFVGFLILPKANIEIYPKTEILPYNLDLTVSSNTQEVDFAANIIPGEILYLEKEESRDFIATGKKNIGEKAKGTITVYNEWDSNPQTLVAGTRFISEGGKLFHSNTEITIPGTTISEGNPVAGTSQVEVTASEPGEDFNIGSSNFTIPGLPATKQEKIYGRSSSDMTGGFSKEVTVVSQDDFNKAREELSIDLYNASVEELKQKDIQGRELLDEAISKERIESIPSVEVGGQSDNFNLRVKAKIQVLVFFENDLIGVASSKLNSVLPEEKDLVYDGRNDTKYQLTNLDLSSGVMILKTEIKGLISSKIKEDELKQNLVGMNKEETEAYLKNLDKFDKVKVDFWPFWVHKVPSRRNNIKIDIKVARPSEIEEIQPEEEKTAE